LLPMAAPPMQQGFSTRSVPVWVLHLGHDPDLASLNQAQRQDLGAALKGNICRCTGYRAIEDALHNKNNIEDAPPAPRSAAACRRRRPAGGAGAARYTFDVAMEACSTSRCCARRIRTPKSCHRPDCGAGAARRACGAHSRRHAGPAVLHRPARVAAMDPDDTRILDTVVRFIGQKVAAVVARPRPLPRKAAAVSRSNTNSPRGVRSGTGDRPRCAFDSRRQDPKHRVANAQRNIVAENHGEFGNVAAALAEAAVSYEGTFTTQRVQHAALETHGGLAWVDPNGCLNVRSSTQTPFLTAARWRIFNLAPDKVRVFCERVGGGFGGKQRCSSRIFWRWLRSRPGARSSLS